MGPGLRHTGYGIMGGRVVDWRDGAMRSGSDGESHLGVDGYADGRHRRRRKALMVADVRRIWWSVNSAERSR